MTIPNYIGQTEEGKHVRLHGELTTQGTGVLSRRRKGKSYLAGSIFESLMHQKRSVVILDPPEAHWGLRYHAGANELPSGPSPFADQILAVQLYSGRHQQAEPRPGELQLDIRDIARLGEVVAESKLSAVVGFNALGPTELCNAGTAFLQALYLRNRMPRLVAFEEAHNFIPEQPAFKEHHAVLFAAKKVCTEGGQKGLGWLVISQRPQRISKDILSQIDNLIVLGMVGPHEIESLKVWFQHNVKDQTMLQEIKDSLPKFHPGEAWLLSPEFMHTMIRFKSRRRVTYHAGRTPKPGERRVNVRRFTVDRVMREFEELLGQRAQENVTLEEANKKIRVLEGEVARAKRELERKVQVSVPAQKVVDEKAVERAVIRTAHEYQQKVIRLKALLEEAMRTIVKVSAIGFENTDLKPEQIEKALESTAKEIARLSKEAQLRRQREFDELKRDAQRMMGKMKKMLEGQDVEVRVQVKHNEPVTVAPSTTPERKVTKPLVEFHGDGSDLTGPERKILQALAELLSVGKETPPKNMVAGWAGYSPVGGAFGNPVGKLRSRGLIDYPSPGAVMLTDAGRTLVGRCPAPDREEIERRIKSTCTGPEQKILSALIQFVTDHGMQEISKEALAERSGYAPVGGAFGNPMGALRTKGLLDYPRPGFVKLAEWVLEG